MRRLPGQAALGAATLVRGLCTLAITVSILGTLAVAAIAWRLSQGPLDLPWLTSRLEEAVNTNGGPTRLAIGSVALAWEGFSIGVDRPLDLRLTDVTVVDQAGGRRISVPRADVSLALRELLFLRIAPRAVSLEAPQMTLVRATDGTLSLDLGSLTEAADSGAAPEAAKATPVADLLAELARPPSGERVRGTEGLFGQLRLVRVRDARITVVDRQLGATWLAPDADIRLARQPQGGVDGTAELTLALGEQRARLTLSAVLSAGAGQMHLRARLSPVTPSALASAAPGLGVLAAVNAPVGAEATLELDRNLAVRDARVNLRAGAGSLRIAQGEVPILDAALVVSGTQDSFTVQALQATLRARDAAEPTRIVLRGTIQRHADQLSAALSLDVDQVDFADLPQLWPAGAAGDARSWLVENIPVGMARNAHVELGLMATPDLSFVTVDRASGTLDGEGLQVHWLRPVPPMDKGRAQLRIVDPDTLEINVSEGRQRLPNQKETSTAGLRIRSGKVRITGLMQARQTAAIEADITGSLPDTLTLLREPRLGLLDKHPIEMRNPAGQVTAKLTVGVPLESTVRIDDVPVRAQARLEGVRLGAVVAGYDLDQGSLELTATNEGLKVSGRAVLAAIPAKLDVALDFRAGPPSQVVQTATVSGQTDARQLAGIGIDTADVLGGAAQVQAVLTKRRNGQGDVAVTADFNAATLAVTALEWRKPPNVPAKGSARVLMDRDRLTAIDAIQVDGDGLLVRGRAELADGRVTAFRMDRLVLGRSTMQGNVRWPASGPITMNLSGAALDLGPRLKRQSTPQPANRSEPPPGPAWTLDARFDEVLMANGRVASSVMVQAQSDGRVVRQLRLDGRTGPNAPFVAQIALDRGGRSLAVRAEDAGEVLRALNYVRTMQGGKLSVQAQYDDAAPGRPLAGTAEIDDFRVRNAPALGKLLQAMTLYGLVELVQGQGLGFSRLVAPFRLVDDAVDLTDARAFSPSLGLTAKGRLDFNAERIDMQGTIVPAYFFNTLLGNIPLVGKLFSPERGGGVFAASYTLRGRLEDPDVFVNPLAALTPGFLRGLFGLF